MRIITAALIPVATKAVIAEHILPLVAVILHPVVRLQVALLPQVLLPAAVLVVAEL
jgi:hypothetical protein